MRVRAAWAAVLLAVLPACQRSSADVVTGKDVLDMVEASSAAPRRFTVERQTVGASVAQAEGAVEDDYRYQVTFSVDGAEAWSEVVYDDARFLRVAPRSDAPVWAAAAAGEWAKDAAGAPAEFARPGQPVSALPPSLALGQVRYLEELPKRLRGLRKWDPDSTRYLEAHDKFPRHEADGIRFDVIPAAYDGDVVFKDGVPTDLQAALEPYFLYVSVWVDDGRVRRVELLFDIDVDRVRADMARAARIHAERAGIRVDPAAAPAAPARFAERLLLDYPPDGVTVSRPAATATVAIPLAGAPS